MGLSSFRTICVTVCRTHLTKEWSLVCERHPSQSCSELISLPAFSAAACSERPSYVEPNSERPQCHCCHVVRHALSAGSRLYAPRRIPEGHIFLRLSGYPGF